MEVCQLSKQGFHHTLSLPVFTLCFEALSFAADTSRIPCLSHVLTFLIVMYNFAFIIFFLLLNLLYEILE